MAKKKRTKKRRSVEATPKPTSSAPSRTLAYPQQIHARLIGSSVWQLTAKLNDYDPGRPESVRAAFESIGLKGPFGVFYRVEHVPLDEISAHYKGIANGTVPPGTPRPAPQYRTLDENAELWDAVRANVHLSEMAYGRFSEFPGTFGTQCGRVEQWLMLSRLAQHCLGVLRSPSPGFQLGFLMRKRDPDFERDLCLAVTEGPPILAAGENRDFEPRSTHQPKARVLSVAGQAVLFWAEATLRLRAMFNEVDVLTRAQMKATASLFERRKPLLDWTGEDESLLADVRRELIAFAPLWKKKTGAPAGREWRITFPASQSLDHESTTQPFVRPVRVADMAKVVNERSDKVLAKLRSRNHRIGGVRRALFAEFADVVATYPHLTKRLREWADKNYPQ